MDYYCGDCAHLKDKERVYYGDEYYCDACGKTRKRNQKACSSSFIPKPKSGYKPFGIPWYIVSALCQKQIISTDSLIYKSSLLLKDYLETTEEGLAFLAEYNEIGPVIANKLLEDDTNEIGVDIVNRFLMPCHQAIMVNDFDQAFLIYQNMVDELKEIYELGTKINSEDRGPVRIRPNI